jgi:hypothetical protein
MSTTISEPAAPTNNVVVRSRVPGEPYAGIGRVKRPALRPTNTRTPYTKWHPGCLSGKCASNQNMDINQPFTTKVPKKTWRPNIARMARKKTKDKKTTETASEATLAARLCSGGADSDDNEHHSIALVDRFPWLTMDVLVGSSVGVLAIALLITIFLKAIA